MSGLDKDLHQVRLLGLTQQTLQPEPVLEGSYCPESLFRTCIIPAACQCPPKSGSRDQSVRVLQLFIGGLRRTLASAPLQMATVQAIILTSCLALLTGHVLAQGGAQGWTLGRATWVGDVPA
jgi:hypothetical protein